MAILDIGNIFTATPKSTWQFLAEEGQGCYLPAYQRHYSWDDKNINRLLEDAVNGIGQLLERDSTISFLGTIIAISDRKLKTVEPCYQPMVPSGVISIIDGQQRISTLLMINIALYDLLSGQLSKLKKTGGQEEISWIVDQIHDLLPNLKKSFIIDMNYGDGAYRYYPRMIRAFDDAWSRKSSEAKYTSPIANLIWNYNQHINEGRTSKFTFDLNDSEGKKVSSMFKYIRKELEKICLTDTDAKEFPDMINISQNTDFQRSLWNFDLPSYVISYITEKTFDAVGNDYTLFNSTLRIIIFAKYIHNRMAFTFVSTESEDDAFDMFEALNTTGEPLTAFETFKPEIIRAEGQDKYKNSPSHKYVEEIEKYLDNFHKAEDKQKATNELLIPFRLAENGERLRKTLNEQRRYLRKTFDPLNLNKKRDFVGSLSNLSQFMKNAWTTNEAPSFPPLKLTDDETLICFDALRQMNHDIVIAPLSRFYEAAVLEQNADNQKQKAEELSNAIKATTAFSILWRGAKGGTENIDGIYRKIMKDGIETPPLARNPDNKKGVVSLKNYKKMLLRALEEAKIKEKSDWTQKASKVPIYNKNKVVSRFILFCASNDAILDSSKPGLITKGTKRVQHIFRYNEWTMRDYFSVEHIAIRNNDGSWDNKIYEDPDTIHVLGNLILLPIKENEVIGDKPWKFKKLIYAALSAESQDDLDQRINNIKSAGLTLSTGLEKVLVNSTFLVMCKSVSTYDKDWNAKFIQERSERIASLAYDMLTTWLN